MENGVNIFNSWNDGRNALRDAGFSRLPDLDPKDRPMYYKPSIGQYATMDWASLLPPVVHVTVRGTVL